MTLCGGRQKKGQMAPKEIHVKDKSGDDTNNNQQISAKTKIDNK